MVNRRTRVDHKGGGLPQGLLTDMVDGTGTASVLPPLAERSGHWLSLTPYRRARCGRHRPCHQSNLLSYCRSDGPTRTSSRQARIARYALVTPRLPAEAALCTV